MIERENIFRMSKDYTGLGTHCSLEEATIASPRVHRSARSNRLIKLILREHNPCVICQRWPAQVSQNSHIICFLLGFGNRSSEPLFSPWPPQHWISVHQMYKQFYPRKHKCFMMYQICWYIILAFIFGVTASQRKIWTKAIQDLRANVSFFSTGTCRFVKDGDMLCLSTHVNQTNIYVCAHLRVSISASSLFIESSTMTVNACTGK